MMNTEKKAVFPMSGTFPSGATWAFGQTSRDWRNKPTTDCLIYNSKALTREDENSLCKLRCTKLPRMAEDIGIYLGNALLADVFQAFYVELLDTIRDEISENTDFYDYESSEEAQDAIDTEVEAVEKYFDENDEALRGLFEAFLEGAYSTQSDRRAAIDFDVILDRLHNPSNYRR